MSVEDIGYVCRPPCGHFTRAFVIHAPFTMLDIHQAADKLNLPDNCEQCGASLASLNLEPESERRTVKAESDRIRNDPSRRWQL